MYKRIHILGASGSGTTTIGKTLAERLSYTHFDTDSYYWIPTVPPFRVKREVDERKSLIFDDFRKHDKWILTGSLCSWGDDFIPHFGLVIFVQIPPALRMKRLADRERQRYGEAILPGGELHMKYTEFMDWASQYDEGDESVRSLKTHNQWLTKIPCRIMRITNEINLDDKINLIIEEMNSPGAIG